ncbi:MAG TPA: iron ABC transporter permease [Anaerolineae bacterium]|nr:iron ABC transporter permease [Anaerolineae bacterium]
MIATKTEAGRARRWPARLKLPRLTDARWWIMGGTILFVFYLAGVPLLLLLWGSLKIGGPTEVSALTLENFREAYSDPRSYTLLLNSVVYAGGTCLFSLILGTSLAFVIERTNTPLKSLFTAMALVPLIVPGILHTIAWILLLSPRIGVVNRALMGLLGLAEAPFNIYSLGGMIWVEGLHLSPLVFVIMAAAFRSMDPALEEAALTSGAGVPATLRRVTLQLARPAIASTMLIMFIRGLESFEVPALIGLDAGVRVFTSRIFLALKEFPPNYGLAAAFAVGLLLISVIGILLYNRLTANRGQFATVTGKGFRPHLIDLGKWRYVTSLVFVLYFLFLVGLPLLILLWTSLNRFYTIPALDKLGGLTLDNYAFVMNMGRARTSLVNSLILSVSSATVVMLVTAVIAWITVKTRWPGRVALDVVTFLPITIPGLVLGVSLIWMYLVLPIPIYGTLWILLLAYITRYMPYGIRANSASMVQIHDELEEAASVAGSSWLQTFRRVTLPLLKPGLIAGWIYVVVVSFRELSSSILLYSSKSIVLSILIFDLWDGGQFPIVAALSVMMVLILVVLVAIAYRLGARFGVRE